MALLSLPSKATAGDYPVDASVTRSLDQSSPLLALETHLEKVSIESSHKFSPIKKKNTSGKTRFPPDNQSALGVRQLVTLDCGWCF